MARISPVRPAVVRSKLVLEIASELVGDDGFLAQQAMVSLRPQGSPSWEFSLFGSDSAASLLEVADGRTTLGIVNPSAMLTVATRGTPPFRGPLPLRAIAVIPSGDQLVLAVTGSTGLSSLEELVQSRQPLRVSLRGQRDHSVHLVLDHVLGASGLSLADIREWGGEIRYDDGLPARGNRLPAVLRGDVDAIFDEAAGSWLADAIAGGMHVLDMAPDALDRLVRWGYRRATLSPEEFPGLEHDVGTPDFSGFAVFVREDAPSDLVRRICRALDARSDRIPAQDGRSLQLSVMCSDTPEAPLGVAFHDAAAEYWREHGYA